MVWADLNAAAIGFLPFRDYATNRLEHGEGGRVVAHAI
jgi:hypothetical protein